MVMTANEVVSRRPVRRYAVWLVLSVLVIGVVATWGTSVQALSTSRATGVLVAGAGDTIHVGHAGLVTRPVVVRDFGAPTARAFDVEFWVCEPRPYATVVGVVSGDDIASHCASLEPLARGTQLPVHAPDEVGPYLITTLTLRTSDVAVFCGFDLSYRSGWRLGRQNQVGSYRVVVNGETSVADDVCR
jgi:hypothetical protein